MIATCMYQFRLKGVLAIEKIGKSIAQLKWIVQLRRSQGQIAQVNENMEVIQ